MMYLLPTTILVECSTEKRPDPMTYLNMSLCNYLSGLKESASVKEAHFFYHKVVEIYSLHHADLFSVAHEGSSVVQDMFRKKYGALYNDGPSAVVSCESTGNLAAAISKIKPKGTLVLDVGHLFSLASVQIAYMMCACFKQVHVHVPLAAFEHEKFLICTGYDPHPNVLELLQSGDGPYTFDMSLYFLGKINEINSVYGQIQLENARNEPKNENKFNEWRSKYAKT
jgi:hypothetical protein